MWTGPEGLTPHTYAHDGTATSLLHVLGFDHRCDYTFTVQANLNGEDFVNYMTITFEFK